MNTEAKTPTKTKRENPFLDLVFTILIPSLILSKLSGPDDLGPQGALILALAFPIFFALKDFITKKKANYIAILGFANVLLTGVLGLMTVEGVWFAVKEAAVPSLIGIAVLLTANTSRPLVKTFLYNDAVMDTDAIAQNLEAKQRTEDFDSLMKKVTWLLAASFLLSAILNFGLARWILVSETGTEAFNQELARMNLLSYPVIVAPCVLVTGFALWKLINGIKTLTGLKTEEILRTS